MKPVLRSAVAGERKISDVVLELDKAFGVTEDERVEFARLRGTHEVGCRVKWTYRTAELDESFFE